MADSIFDETWRVIVDYPDYEVSDLGRVRRLTSRTSAKAGRILSTRGLRAGYPSVDLCGPGGKRTLLVHRLVAAAFIGPADGREVNHINGRKTDPAAVNLEYVTASENRAHGYRIGVSDARGVRNSQAKLTPQIAADIRELAAQPNRLSYAAIGRMFGVTDSNVRAVVKGRTWK